MTSSGPILVCVHLYDDGATSATAATRDYVSEGGPVCWRANV